jgi:hypothetical protein
MFRLLKKDYFFKKEPDFLKKFLKKDFYSVINFSLQTAAKSRDQGIITHENAREHRNVITQAKWWRRANTS